MNNNNLAGDSTISLLHLFELQCLKTPDNIAIIEHSLDYAITYSQLYEAALKLSHAIRNAEQNDNEFLAILLPQGQQFLKSVLAAWLAGKIPVPLSIDYPLTQLTYILEIELRNPLVITTADILEMSGLNISSTQFLTPGKIVNTSEHSSKPTTNGVEHEIAYCFFTSGSTGRPKGVQVSHASYVNVVDWAIKQCDLTSLDRTLAFGSPVFDVSILEIWPTFTVGGTLCIPPHHYRYHLQSLVNWISELQITYMALPTAVGVRILTEHDSSLLASLRWMLIGGEALTFYPSPKLPFQIINLYGPTEAAVLATFIHLNSLSDSENKLPPIGKPINSLVQIYLLNERNELITAPNSEGEICIGGIGLAKGYLNQPELTNRKFVTNPFSSDDKVSKIYRTGDLGYWNTNGNLCFVGRIDNQIKFHGFRLELENIENAFRAEFENISQAVVVLEEQNGGIKFLTAFCTIKQSDFGRFNEIIAKLQLNLFPLLKNRLSHYEIPSKIFILPPGLDFSLTTAGKINRKAISGLKNKAILITSNYEELKGETEIMIGQIWSELINIPYSSIGRQDNFFGLGGNSIIAIQMIMKIDDFLSAQELVLKGFQLHHVFRGQTLCEIAKLVEVATTSCSDTPPKPIALNETELIPLSSSQKLIWSQLNQLDELDWNQCNQAINLKFYKITDKSVLTQAIHQVLDRHDVLKSTFVRTHDTSGHFKLGRISEEEQIIDLTSNVHSWSESKGLLIKNSNICLINRTGSSEGPLIKFFILKVGPGNFHVHLIGHQLILDVTSINIIVWELQQFVHLLEGDQFNESHACIKTTPKYQYRDFVFWQSHFLKSKDHEVAVEFWQSYLENWTPIRLIQEEDLNSISGYAGVIHPFQLDSTLTKQLKSFAKEKHTTVFNLLMATFKIILYLHTAKSPLPFDLSIMSIVLGRELEFGATVGQFTNPVVIRTKNLNSGLSFESLVQELQENVTNVYEHSQLPVQSILEAADNYQTLTTKEDSRNLFNYSIQMAPRSPIELKTVRNAIQIYSSDLTRQKLMLTFEGEEAEIDGFLEANSNIFSSQQLKQFVQQYKTILYHGISFPSSKIDQLLKFN